MLSIAVAGPSPITQTAVYMAGMLGGYLLLTRPEEWTRVREAVRSVWLRNRRD
jgi:hypothetical protein